MPFVWAVLVGSMMGVLSQQFLLTFLSPTLAGNVSLALATTGTGATHARLVHRRPLGSLVPNVLLGAPVAYGVMRVVHLFAGL